MIVHYKQGTTDFLGMDNIITPLVVHAEIEREINGIFNAELLIIKDSEMKYDKIKTLDFLKIPTPGGDQLFRIVDIDDTATHTITVFCKHIFFDLQKRLIKDTFIQQRNGTQALQQILNSLDEPTEFMAFSDITTLNNLRLVRTKGIDAILGGNQDNYLIERYKGEIDVDNFRIKLLKRLGTDRGYEIREGKNLTGYDYKEDSSELCTRLMPVLFDGKLIPETYVDSPNITKYDMVHTNTIKFDDIKLKERNDDGTIKPDNSDEEYVNEGYNTENDMFIEARKRCKKLFEEGLDKVRVQASVNFVDLSRTEQYKDFQFLHRLDLGDTVHFILEKYNLRVAERIVSYRYNALTKEYNELELGHAQDSIFSSGGGINGSGGSNSGDIGSGDGEGTPNINFDKWYEQIIKDVTNQIHTGMKDSYVLVRQNEILIMDTKDISTAKQVWRWNRGGLGFSSNGYNGTYSTAMTSNGQFVINEVTCQKFVGDLIDVGTLQADRLSVEAKSEIREGLVTQSSFNVSLEEIKAEVGKKTDVTDVNSIVEQKADSIKQSVSSIGLGNLITNGDFEIGNWNGWSKNLDASLFVAGGGVTGASDQCLGIQSPNGGDGRGVYQFFKTTPGKQYSFSFYGWLTNGSAYCAAEGHDLVCFTDCINKWKRFTLTFTAKTESVGITFYSNYSGVSTFFVDNIMVTEGSIPMEYSPKSPSTSYVEQQLTSDSITQKVSSGLANGTNITGTTTTLTKDKFSVSQAGNSARVDIANGGVETFNSAGKPSMKMTDTIFSLYDWDRTDRRVVGTLASVKTGTERQIMLSAGVESNGLMLGYKDNNSSAVHTQQLEFRRGTVGFLYLPIDIFNNDFRVKSINQYSPGANGVIMNNLYFKSHSISSNIYQGWMWLNQYNSNVLAVSRGANDGRYGTIKCSEVQQIKEGVVQANDGNHNLASYNMQTVSASISDVGHGKIGENGEVAIFFDNDFLSFADTYTSYFVTYEVIGRNRKSVYTIEHNEKYFIVGGEVGQEFTFRVECKKRGLNALRYCRDIEQSNEVISTGQDSMEGMKADYNKQYEDRDNLYYINHENEKLRESISDSLESFNINKSVEMLNLIERIKNESEEN